MTPKEKALQLWNRFQCVVLGEKEDGSPFTMQDTECRECALICVDEIIASLKITTDHLELRRLDLHEVHSDFDYWEQVKTEIKKL